METEKTETTETTTFEAKPVIPWLDKQLLQDRRIVMAPPPANAIIDPANPDATKPRAQVVDENIMQDFKTFVLTANNRPIDFQVMQIMLAIKQLMDVCEKQQILIESINAMLKAEQKVLNS
jgi:hypothetical protein